MLSAIPPTAAYQLQNGAEAFASPARLAAAATSPGRPPESLPPFADTYPSSIQEDAARESSPGAERLEHAREVQQAFADFFGKTFFSQMLKAMRSSQRPAAYFHGGQAEEIFRSQLDQTLADEMTKSSATQFSEAMFTRQFPELATVLKEHDRQLAADPQPPSGLEQLQTLRRR